jgi:hypothetical protein
VAVIIERSRSGVTACSDRCPSATFADENNAVANECDTRSPLDRLTMVKRALDCRNDPIRSIDMASVEASGITYGDRIQADLG